MDKMKWIINELQIEYLIDIKANVDIIRQLLLVKILVLVSA